MARKSQRPQPHYEQIVVDHDAFMRLVELANERSEASTVYLYATLLGIAVGAMVFVGGFVLAVLGLAGAIEWIVEAGSASSRLSNASPGVVFAVAGMVILWRYKPKVRNSLEIRPYELIQYDLALTAA